MTAINRLVGKWGKWYYDTVGPRLVVCIHLFISNENVIQIHPLCPYKLFNKAGDMIKTGIYMA